MTDRYYAELWRESAQRNREFAELALCDEARNDHLTWARTFDRLADTCVDHIDYTAITRDVCYLS